MAQLRKDPITSRWIIVNTENPKRPDEFQVEPHTQSTKVCPFCPGNEAMTPPEILVHGRRSGAKNTSSWLVRVVPNKFPALRIEESTEKAGIGIYEKVGGFGAHEVIIENPDHNKQLADLPLDHVELVFKAFRDRCLDLRKDPRFKYILIFKNYGSSAGASLEHPHSQLIGLPIVPSRVLGEIRGSTSYHEASDRCIYCDIISQERSEKKLTVFENDEFVSLCPFASRFPFENCILPKNHQSSFDAVEDRSLHALAQALKATLVKIKKVLKDPAFNFMIHTIPMYSKEFETYHWHVEIIPQLTRVAGFELGTGFYVNPTPPEMAAEALRCVTIPGL
ncbi:MAG: galactose-1-phosphate uridylyltransferase [Omnitrophica bacterium RIFCSPHIGHO2_02_FULL_51_18]|nr:MAG: galactose-1-phosphate uridylyltransferase [Omnitrophica bacterium RIFCSPHIGHO2_02_FULL_51_18]